MTPNLRHATTSATALVLLSLALAGCSGLDNSDAETVGRNRAPTAELTVSEDTVWAGDDVTFDASGSSDPDGEIVRYTFDFGDDTPPLDVADTTDDDPQATHVFAEGGEYVVTLTVTDDGGNETGALTDTDTVRVTVNQEFPVASAVVQDTPLEDSNATRVREIPFVVNRGANNFELELEVVNTAPLAASEITIEVVDAENETIDTETVTVSGDEVEEVTMDGLLTNHGEHTLRFTAESGGATLDGNVQVLYGSEEE